MKIQLTKGYEAIIDSSDYELICGYNWFAKKIGYTVYANTNITVSSGRQATLSMHRLIMDAKKGMQVDHIDHDGLNNRRSNLRICTVSQNQMNRINQSNNTSGFRGVTWHKHRRKWMAQIRFNGKQKCLGYFLTQQDAYAAYCKASKELHGEFSNVH